MEIELKNKNRNLSGVIHCDNFRWIWSEFGYGLYLFEKSGEIIATIRGEGMYGYGDYIELDI